MDFIIWSLYYSTWRFENKCIRERWIAKIHKETGISSANVWLASFYPITSTERIPSPSSLHEDPFTPPRQLTRGIRDSFVFIGSSGFLCEGRTMEGEEKKKKERSRTREKERKLRNRNRWKKECFRSLTGRGGKNAYLWRNLPNTAAVIRSNSSTFSPGERSNGPVNFNGKYPHLA